MLSLKRNKNYFSNLKRINRKIEKIEKQNCIDHRIYQMRQNKNNRKKIFNFKIAVFHFRISKHPKDDRDSIF